MRANNLMGRNLSETFGAFNDVHVKGWFVFLALRTWMKGDYPFPWSGSSATFADGKAWNAKLSGVFVQSSDGPLFDELIRMVGSLVPCPELFGSWLYDKSGSYLRRRGVFPA